MLLKKYKYIKNQKPMFKGGTDDQGANFNLGGSLQSAANFAGDVFSVFNAPVVSSSQLMLQAGMSQNAINGVQYDQQNSVDVEGAEKDLAALNSANTTKTTLSGLSTGASIGSSFGPIGAGVGAAVGAIAGGIFGGISARKKKKQLQRNIFNAQQRTNRINVFNKSGALSDALMLDYSQKYGNTQDDVLYANRGKDKMKYNRGKVWSPDGYMQGDHNSYVGKGESIINFNTGKASLVNKGKIGVDNQPSSVQNNDDNVILGNDVDWSNGYTFAQQAAPYTDYILNVNNSRDKVGKYNKLSSLSEQTKTLYNKLVENKYQQAMDKLKQLADKQQYQHEVENNYEQYPQYDGGKSWFAKHSDDIQTILPSAIGMIEGLTRYKNTNNQDIERSNTYFTNPYQSRALNGLANLRYDIYPQLNEYRNAMRLAKYATSQSGGLTAGQKYIANTSMYNNYIDNVAKLYATADAQNNQYKAQYYDALMKAGDADRSALTAAKRYDDEVYAKAHAARLTAANQALKDTMENLYRLDKRHVDNKRWKDTLGIYRDDTDIKLRDIQSRLPQTTNNSYTFLPTDSWRNVMYKPVSDYLINGFKFFGK